MKTIQRIFNSSPDPEPKKEGEKPSLEQLLIGTSIKKFKATPDEAQIFYKIVGIFLNTFTVGKPILLVYTYLKENNSYQIVEYQTGLLVQKPKAHNLNYLNLEELKSADHNGYFTQRVKDSQAYFKSQGAIITSVEVMLYFLTERNLKSRGLLNKIPENVLVEMRRPFMGDDADEEDMFGE